MLKITKTHFAVASALLVILGGTAQAFDEQPSDQDAIDAIKSTNRMIAEASCNHDDAGNISADEKQGLKATCEAATKLVASALSVHVDTCSDAEPGAGTVRLPQGSILCHVNWKTDSAATDSQTIKLIFWQDKGHWRSAPASPKIVQDN